MVKCLILYHHTITSLTKCFMLRAMFQDEDLEIHVKGNNTVVIFLWNVPKTTIWQTVLDFEIASIMTGYGEGKIKKEAESVAWQLLYKRTALEKGKDGFYVEEEQAAYSIDVAT